MPYESNPFKRIELYSKPSPGGGTNVDIEAMVSDLITIFKAVGLTQEDLITAVRETWAEVTVNITLPKNSKN